MARALPPALFACNLLLIGALLDWLFRTDPLDVPQRVTFLIPVVLLAVVSPAAVGLVLSRRRWNLLARLSLIVAGCVFTFGLIELGLMLVPRSRALAADAIHEMLRREQIVD